MQSLETALIPENLTEVNDHLITKLNFITSHLPSWILSSTSSLPNMIFSVKSRVLDDFLKSIKKKTALIPLVKSCDIILRQFHAHERMISDLRRVDLNGVSEDIKLFPLDAINQIKKLIDFLLKWDPEAANSSLNEFLKYLSDSINQYFASSQSFSVQRGCDLILTMGRTLNSLSRELTLVEL